MRHPRVLAGPGCHLPTDRPRQKLTTAAAAVLKCHHTHHGFHSCGSGAFRPSLATQSSSCGDRGAPATSLLTAAHAPYALRQATNGPAMA